MTKLLKLLVVSLLIPAAIQAADAGGAVPESELPVDSIIIDGVATPITPDRLKDWCAVPSDKNKAVKSFVRQNHYLIGDILRRENTYESPDQMKKTRERLNRAAQEVGLKNLSTWNYVFRMSELNLFAKLPGADNTQENYNAYLNLPYGNALTEPQYRSIPYEHRQIYQGISSAAYYLLLKQAIAHFKYENIFHAPATYLVTRTNFEYAAVDDISYVVFQESVENAKPITSALLKKRETQFKKLITAVGLWNLSKDNLLQTDEERPRIALFDLEQPSYTSPQEFFHRNRKRFESNGKEGLASLTKTMSALAQKEAEEQKK